MENNLPQTKVEVQNKRLREALQAFLDIENGKGTWNFGYPPSGVHLYDDTEYYDSMGCCHSQSPELQKAIADARNLLANQL